METPVRCLANFEGVGESELSLTRGELVWQLKVDPSGWAKGRQGEFIGWYPATYVEPVDAAFEELWHSYPDLRPGVPLEAKGDFHTENVSGVELRIDQGQIVEFISFDPNGSLWILVQAQEQIGWIPLDYVYLTEEETADSLQTTEEAACSLQSTQSNIEQFSSPTIEVQEIPRSQSELCPVNSEQISDQSVPLKSSVSFETMPVPATSVQKSASLPPPSQQPQDTIPLTSSSFSARISPSRLRSSSTGTSPGHSPKSSPITPTSSRLANVGEIPRPKPITFAVKKNKVKYKITIEVEGVLVESKKNKTSFRIPLVDVKRTVPDKNKKTFTFFWRRNPQNRSAITEEAFECANPISMQKHFFTACLYLKQQMEQRSRTGST